MYGLNINFDYDITKNYRLEHENQCDCAYCRNYYETFKTKYPNIARFLEEFGLDIKFPLEIMPLEYNKLHDEMKYISYYPVKGVINKNKLILNLDKAEIRILKSSDSNNLCPTPKMKEPYLLVEISGIKLPWVLDEDV